MDKTIELVNLWGAFIKQHPEGSIEDFCRHLLVHKREKENKGPLVGGVVPHHSNGLLMKIIGRIFKLHRVYSFIALEGAPVSQVEEFGILATIKQRKNPKKSEVIYDNLLEFSSGTDMIARLKKKGFVKEVNDKEDSRSKRLLLTAAGEKAFEACTAQIIKLSALFFDEMPEDDKHLCIQLLKNVEIKFSALVHKHKGKKFEDIYAEVMNG